MVEGHSVHRVASSFRSRLVGKRFQATSPNGRFSEGAKLIDGKPFLRIEAVGKNLFAFFGETGEDPVVVHVHFGMSGVWAVFDSKAEEVPETKETTRLVLEDTGSGLVAHLSAMTVDHGTTADLYDAKRSKLGQDPLRADADPELLWAKVSQSNKSIGALIMDQSYFTGPGNIYRAEILFKAAVHPEVKGKDLTREQFARVWYHTVDLLRRGFQSGSIVTVDAEEAARLGRPKLRRYIYNQKKCGRCQGPVVSWDIQTRTCYACVQCQPMRDALLPMSVPAKVFHSHCARETLEDRLQQDVCKLTVAEMKGELCRRGLPTDGKKPALEERLRAALAPPDVKPLSAAEAAREKAEAGENRAVEHVAELAPSQAARAGHGRAGTSRRVAKRARGSPDAPAGEGAAEAEVKVESPGAAAGPAADEGARLRGMKVAELRALAAEAGLPAAGLRKAELVQALAQARAAGVGSEGKLVVDASVEVPITPPLVEPSRLTRGERASKRRRI